jgi:deferrochelatase/peroxidase EfeB
VPQANGNDIGRNGTFLVLRQIEQHPHELNDYVDTEAKRYAASQDPRVPTHNPVELAEWISAKMVGRWKDGTSLVRNPNYRGSMRTPPAVADNTFLFGREDPDGLRCPFGAHIRRANPRDSFDPGSQVQIDISNRHRILRVGRGYAAAPKAEPGLLFMCVNADIERQFEFLQQSWILGANFHGLEDEVDPIVGCKGKSMVVPTPSGPLKLQALREFVKVLGGGYFFMPSRSAVAWLAH